MLMLLMEQEELDEAIAISLAEEDAFANDASDISTIGLSNDLNLDDPNPDIYPLFAQFNAQYFHNLLASVEIKWSHRMTYCAGVCSYQGREGYCSIRLSEPLLKYRPRSDLIDTLLHEMIHAYLFITKNNRDHGAHGPEFCSLMHHINQQASTTISVYHSFHDEVDNYRKHIWQCNGPCRMHAPFFGLVKRSMNRPPQPHDRWYADHQHSCGGQFSKISEPVKKESARKKKKLEMMNPIASYFSHATEPLSNSSMNKSNKSHPVKNDIINCQSSQQLSTGWMMNPIVLTSSDDDEQGETCHLAFKFPNGERIVESFGWHTKMDRIYQFIRKFTGNDSIELHYLKNNGLRCLLPFEGTLQDYGLACENHACFVKFL